MGTVNDELDRIAALPKEMLVPTDIIDNDKGYSPDNCRWADMKTQVGNRSCCRKGESV